MLPHHRQHLERHSARPLRARLPLLDGTSAGVQSPRKDSLTYLFAKKDRANIDAVELTAFRELAKGYDKLTAAQLTALLKTKELVEICHVDQA